MALVNSSSCSSGWQRLADMVTDGTYQSVAWPTMMQVHIIGGFQVVIYGGYWRLHTGVTTAPTRASPVVEGGGTCMSALARPHCFLTLNGFRTL